MEKGKEKEMVVDKNKEWDRFEEEYENIIGVFWAIYPTIREFSPISILSMIGLLIDQYAADHGIDAGEMHDNLNKVSHFVNDAEGPMDKSPYLQ